MLPIKAERSRLVGLDILRGIAAYAVVISHCSSPIGVIFHADLLAAGEFLGRLAVEIFFALSGFLIGGVLLKLVDRQRSAKNFGIFLVRRWMRTLPVYYVALAIFAAYPTVFEPGPLLRPLAYLTFTQNIIQANADFFRVSWSLTIEEWFYIFLAGYVFIATALVPRRRGYLVGVAAIMVMGFVLRLRFVPSDNHAVAARIDAIAYGCLLAYLVNHEYTVRMLRQHAIAISVISAVAFLALIGFEQTTPLNGNRLLGAALYSAIPFVSAGTLCAFVFWEPRSPTLVKIAAFSAAVSYPLYVCHNEIIVTFMTGPAGPGTGIVNLVFIVVTSTAFAYLTHVLIEAPFMRWRPRFLDGPAKVPFVRPRLDLWESAAP